MAEIKIIDGNPFADLREDPNTKKLFDGAVKGCFGRKFSYDLACCTGDKRRGSRPCPLAENCEAVRRARDKANLGPDDFLVPVEIVGKFGIPADGIELPEGNAVNEVAVPERVIKIPEAPEPKTQETVEIFAVRTTLTKAEFDEAAEDVLKLARESIVSDLEHRYALGQRLSLVAEKCTRAEFLNWADADLGMGARAALDALRFARMVASEGFDEMRENLLQQSGLNWTKVRLLTGAKPEEVKFVLEGKDARGRAVANLSAREVKKALKDFRSQQREKPEPEEVDDILGRLEGEDAAPEPAVELLDGAPPVNPGAYMIGTVRSLISNWAQCRKQIHAENVASLRPKEIEKLKEQVRFFKEQFVPDMEKFFEIIGV